MNARCLVSNSATDQTSGILLKKAGKNNPISLGSECLPLSFSSLSLLQTQIVVILVHENAVRAKREWIRIAFNAINECGQHEGRPVMVVVVM